MKCNASALYTQPDSQVSLTHVWQFLAAITWTQGAETQATCKTWPAAHAILGCSMRHAHTCSTSAGSTMLSVASAASGLSAALASSTCSNPRCQHRPIEPAAPQLQSPTLDGPPQPAALIFERCSQPPAMQLSAPTDLHVCCSCCSQHSSASSYLQVAHHALHGRVQEQVCVGL